MEARYKEYREKKKLDKRRKLFIRAVVGFCISGLLLIIVLNFGSLVAPLEGIGHNLLGGNRNLPPADFPVSLPGNADVIGTLNSGNSGTDNGFALLSPTYFYAYTVQGAQRFGRRHSFAFPKADFEGNRALVYDHNGQGLFVFSVSGGGRSEITVEMESDDRIIYATIAQNGNIAVITRNDVHTNILMVYGASGEWLYTKRFYADNVMQATFTPDGRFVVVTTIGFDSGRLVAAVRKFDITCDDEHGVWRSSLTAMTSGAAEVLPVSLYVSSNHVFVLCNSALFVLNAVDGDIIGSYGFRGNVIDHSFADGVVAILINDFTAGQVNLIALDSRAQVLGTAVLASSATQTEIGASGNVAVLASGAIVLFEDSSLTVSETYPLSEDLTQFVFVTDNILMLGYNTVAKLFVSEDGE
jgi:hypothetical protein